MRHLKRTNISLFILMLGCSLVLGKGQAVAQDSPQGESQTEVSKPRRGMISSALCPYSCKDAGIPKEHCKEWSGGEKCYVEDLSQPPGHQSVIRVPLNQPRAQDKRGQLASPPDLDGRRGLITSSLCPYSCKDENIPAGLCKDWQAGEHCYTEDFTSPPGHRSRVKVPR